MMYRSAVLVSLLSTLAVAAPPSPPEQSGHPQKPPGITSVNKPLAAGVIVPGPGMPSLESLGVTASQLFDPNFKKADKSPAPPSGKTLFAKRQNYCLSDGLEATLDNAVACRNYLYQVGNDFCTTGGGSAIVLVSAGDAKVTGWNYFNRIGGVQTRCGDAGDAANWIIGNCQRNVGNRYLVEGSKQAPGNSEYVVFIDRY